MLINKLTNVLRLFVLLNLSSFPVGGGGALEVRGVLLFLTYIAGGVLPLQPRLPVTEL